MKFFFNTGVRIASSNLGTTRLQTLYPKEKRDHLLSPTITKYDGVVACFDAFSIHGWAIVESYVLEGHFEPILFLKLHLSLWFQYASHFIILSNSKCVQVS